MTHECGEEMEAEILIVLGCIRALWLECKRCGVAAAVIGEVHSLDV